MRDLLGPVAAVAAAGLLLLAFRRRREARSRAERGMAPPPLHPSLRLMAEIGPGIVQFFTAMAGLVVVAAFLVSDGGDGAMSLLDLGGFLLLLVAYATWVTVKSRHRL